MTVLIVDPDDDTDSIDLSQYRLFGPDADNPPMKGSLKLIKYSLNKEWALIRSGATREEKWVNVYDIWTEGVLDAFYDADPKFLPSGEKN